MCVLGFYTETIYSTHACEIFHSVRVFSTPQSNSPRLELDVLQLNLIITLSPWRKWQSPQVKGYPTRVSYPPLQTPVESPACYLDF